MSHRAIPLLLAFATMNMVFLASRAPAQPVSTAPANLPGKIQVRYFSTNKVFTVTAPAGCQAVLAWLKKAENGPISEHAMNGACDRDALLEIFSAPADPQPTRIIELFTSCHHVSGRVVTAEQFAELYKLLEHAPECWPGPAAAADNWGPEVGGFRAQLTLLKPQVAVGDPVLVKYVLRNVSKEPREVWHCGFYANHKVVVKDAGAREVALTPRGQVTRQVFDHDQRRKNVSFMMEPGGQDLSEGIDLADLFDLSKPGRYTVEIVLREDKLVLPSNTPGFELTPAPAMSQPASAAVQIATPPAKGGNVTAEFLGPLDRWPACRFSLVDVHMLWGGTSIYMDADNSCLIRTVDKDGEKRFRVPLTPEDTLALRKLFIDNDILAAPIKPRPGIPDETRPTITLRNADGQERSVAKWNNDKVESFDKVYKTLLELTKKTANLKPEYAGPFQRDWKFSIPPAAPATQSDAARTGHEVFVKVIYLLRNPPHAKDRPESWVARELTTHGYTNGMALTGWVRLGGADTGQSTPIWNGHRSDWTDDGHDVQTCPGSARILERGPDGKLTVEIDGFLPVVNKVRVGLPDRPGAQNLAMVVKDRVFVALQIGPPPETPATPPAPSTQTAGNFITGRIEALEANQIKLHVFRGHSGIMTTVPVTDKTVVIVDDTAAQLTDLKVGQWVKITRDETWEKAVKIEPAPPQWEEKKLSISPKGAQ